MMEVAGKKNISVTDAACSRVALADRCCFRTASRGSGQNKLPQLPHRAVLVRIKKMAEKK